MLLPSLLPLLASSSADLLPSSLNLATKALLCQSAIRLRLHFAPSLISLSVALFPPLNKRLQLHFEVVCVSDTGRQQQQGEPGTTTTLFMRPFSLSCSLKSGLGLVYAWFGPDSGPDSAAAAVA